MRTIALLLTTLACAQAATSNDDNIITVDSAYARRSYDSSPYKSAVVGSSYSIGEGGPLPPPGYSPSSYHPSNDHHHSPAYPEPVGDIVKGRPASYAGETYFPPKKHYPETSGYEAQYKPNPPNYYHGSSVYPSHSSHSSYGTDYSKQAYDPAYYGPAKSGHYDSYSPEKHYSDYTSNSIGYNKPTYSNALVSYGGWKPTYSSYSSGYSHNSNYQTPHHGGYDSYSYQKPHYNKYSSHYPSQYPSYKQPEYQPPTNYDSYSSRYNDYRYNQNHYESDRGAYKKS